MAMTGSFPVTLSLVICFLVISTESVYHMHQNDHSSLKHNGVWSKHNGASTLLSAMFNSPQKLDRHKLSHEHLPGVTLVKSFSWSDCGADKSAVQFLNITLGPDPVKIPGNVSLSFHVKSSVDIEAPLEVDLTVKKKVLFWIEVPCVDNFGSCNYKDICDMLAKTSMCPPIFKKYNIPCKCPVKKGDYKLPPSVIPVDETVPIPSWLSNGDYKVEASIKVNGSKIGCLNVELSISA